MNSIRTHVITRRKDVPRLVETVCCKKYMNKSGDLMRKVRDILHFRSIQTKIYVLIILLLIIPTVVTSLFFFNRSQKVVEEKIKEANAQTIDQLSSKVKRYIENIVIASHIFVEDKQIKAILGKGRDMDEQEYYNNSFVVEEKFIRVNVTMLLNYNCRINIFDFYGNTYTSSPSYSVDKDNIWRDTSWFSMAKELRGVPLWVVHGEDNKVSYYGKKLNTITFARFIKGNTMNEGDGLLTLSVLENEFYDSLLNQADSYNNGDEIFIINKEGTVISHNNKSIVGTSMRDVPYVNSILNEESNHFITRVEGKKKLISFADIELTNWIVVKMSDYDNLFKELTSLRNNNIMFIAIILLAYICITSIIIVNIIKPIKKLTYLMKSAEDGNLDVSISIKSRDELYELGKGFNRMITRINELIYNIQEKQKKEEELRLEVLQAQINPHFLFNTLNTIKWTAIISRSENVAKLIEDLGKILEISIKDSKRLISVKDEIDNVRSYINLQKARYNQWIKEEIDIDADILDCKVPKLILQPLIENCFVHGLYKKQDENLTIGITGKMLEEKILIEVRDNGKGIEPERLSQILDDNKKDNFKNRYSRIGLQNVHKRIQIMFGKQYGLEILSRFGEYTIVQVWLPIIKEDN